MSPAPRVPKKSRPSPSPSARPRTAAKRQANGRIRGGLFTTTGGAAERLAAAEKLPYAEPIPEEVLPEVAGMVRVHTRAWHVCLSSSLGRDLTAVRRSSRLVTRS